MTFFTGVKEGNEKAVNKTGRSLESSYSAKVSALRGSP